MSKDIFSSLAGTLNVKMYPEKKNDCPAIPVCEALGNLHGQCRNGANITHPSYHNCIATLVLLLARASGQLSKRDQKKIEQRRIGFSEIGGQS